MFNPLKIIREANGFEKGSGGRVYQPVYRFNHRDKPFQDAGKPFVVTPGMVPYQSASLQIGTSNPEDVIYCLPELDPVVQQAEIYQNLLLASCPKFPGRGYGALVRTRTDSAKTWKEFGVLDSASRSPTTGTYANVITDYKLIYDNFNVSQPLVWMTEDVQDIRTDELDGKMIEVQKAIVKMFFYGDKSYDNGQLFDGCINLVDSGMITHNTDTNGGASFSYKQFTNMWDAMKHGVSALVMTTKMQRAFTEYAEAAGDIQLIKTGTIDYGMQVTTYMGKPIIVNDLITDIQTYDGTETTNWETGGACTSIFFVNWDDLYFEELRPLQIYPLSLTTALHTDYDILGARCLLLRHKYGLGILDGIKNSTT